VLYSLSVLEWKRSVACLMLTLLASIVSHKRCTNPICHTSFIQYLCLFLICHCASWSEAYITDFHLRLHWHRRLWGTCPSSTFANVFSAVVPHIAHQNTAPNFVVFMYHQFILMLCKYSFAAFLQGHILFPIARLNPSPKLSKNWFKMYKVANRINYIYTYNALKSISTQRA